MISVIYDLRFFKVVKVPVVVLWVMRPPSLLDQYKRVGGTDCSIWLEDGGCRFLRNGDI